MVGAVTGAQPADSMVATRPVLGAAMPIEALGRYRDWLLAEQRDLEIQDAFNPAVLDGDQASLLHQARAALAGFTGRLGIHGPFDGFQLNSRDPQVRALAGRRLRQALEFGAELGATHMVIHSPLIFFGSPFLPQGAGWDLADHIASVQATLEPIVPFAEQLGCMLVIENILDKNPAPLLAIIRAFDSPVVRMSLDTGHAFITHQAGGPPPDQWVREAGDLLAHLHLQDSDGQIDRHWSPGDGAINWFALFEALGTLTHRPRLILEVRNKDEIGRGAAYLAGRGLAR